MVEDLPRLAPSFGSVRRSPLSPLFPTLQVTEDPVNDLVLCDERDDLHLGAALTYPILLPLLYFA